MSAFDFTLLERAAKSARDRREKEEREQRGCRVKVAAECRTIVGKCVPIIRKEVPQLAGRFPASHLARLYRIVQDLEWPDDVKLPSLYVSLKHRQTFLDRECPEDVSNERHVWILYPQLELRRILTIKYFGGYNRRMAIFDNFGDLAGQRLDPNCYEGTVSNTRVPWWEAKAALALCTVRLLEFIRKGRLIPLAAERIKEEE